MVSAVKSKHWVMRAQADASAAKQRRHHTLLSQALASEVIVVKITLPAPLIGGAVVRRRLQTPWTVWGKLPMAMVT